MNAKRYCMNFFAERGFSDEAAEEAAQVVLVLYEQEINKAITLDSICCFFIESLKN